jgi:integrase
MSRAGQPQLHKHSRMDVEDAKTPTGIREVDLTPIEDVMAQVGHADAETTMRIYSQLLKRAKRDHGVAFDILVNEARDAVLCGARHTTEATGA